MRKAAKLSAYVLPQLSGTFGTSLVKTMDLLGFTLEKLCETSLISVSTIVRMRGDTGYRPSYRAVVAICVGMNLPPAISRHLILKSGATPLDGHYPDMCYDVVLNTYWYKSIYDVNEMLAEAGVPTLTK